MSNELMPYTPSASEIEYTWKLANRLAETEFAPKPMRGKPDAVLACILTGRELGIGPMQALRDVYLVNGRPSLAATLMVARVRERGHRFRTLSNTDELATVQIHRKGERDPEPPVEFTISDAKRAKLISKDIWQQYPARMCWARAASAACRRDCPEALGGAGYTREELEDDDPATEATWGDPVTGEVWDSLEESPGAGAVTTTPAPAPAATPTVPTLDQVKRLRTIDDARALADTAPYEFKHVLLNHFNHMDEWRAFWRDASLASWKDHLHDAIVQMSAAEASAPPGPAAGPHAPGAAAAGGTRGITVPTPAPEREAGTGVAPNLGDGDG